MLDQLEAGRVTEVVVPPSVSGGALFLAKVFEESEREFALVDGSDSFDVCAYGSILLEKMYWCRCRRVSQALQCTDALLRDGVLPLVIMDLSLCRLHELKEVPRGGWYRLRQLAQRSGVPLMAMTPQPLIPSPGMRRTLCSSLSIDDLESRRQDMRPRWNAEKVVKTQVVG
ncbi:MAG: hypothetical protein ACQKBU_08765 [Verrucomicrobiales bacterium]